MSAHVGTMELPLCSAYGKMALFPKWNEVSLIPNRPVSLQTLATMARVEELSQARRHLSTEERTAVFLRNLEQAQAEAIRKDIAIDDEREAAVDGGT